MAGLYGVNTIELHIKRELASAIECRAMDEKDTTEGWGPISASVDTGYVVSHSRTGGRSRADCVGRVTRSWKHTSELVFRRIHALTVAFRPAICFR